MNELVLGDDLGPRGRRRVAIATAVSLLVIAVALMLAAKRFHDKGQLDPIRYKEWIRQLSEVSAAKGKQLADAMFQQGANVATR